MDEERYQFKKIFLKEGIADRARSDRENEEGNRKKREEWEKILKLKGVNDLEYDRQKMHHNLLLRGWTQEQIDAMYRGEHPDQERWKNLPQTDSLLFAPLRNQEERDALNTRLHGGHNEFTRRLFGLREPEQEPGHTGNSPASESGGVSQPQPSAPRQSKDISRKTRVGRITKSNAQIQGPTNSETRPRSANRRSKQLRQAPDEPDDSPEQAARTIRKRQSKASKERGSDAIKDIDSQVLQSEPHKIIQRKVYKAERESRRLAGHLPEFGMLPKRGEPAPPYQALLRHPSNTRKPNPSGPHGRASSKNSIAIKVAKPQGISKSRHEGTSRSKKSSKQSRG